MRLMGVLSNGSTVTAEGSSKKDFFGLAVLLNGEWSIVETAWNRESIDPQKWNYIKEKIAKGNPCEVVELKPYPLPPEERPAKVQVVYAAHSPEGRKYTRKNAPRFTHAVFVLDRSENWKGFSMHHNKKLAEAEAKNKVREGYLDSVIVSPTIISKREIPDY